MINNRVGLLGATSFVGERLQYLLEREGFRVLAFSRQGGNGTISLSDISRNPIGEIENWACLAPIWTIPEYFNLIENLGGKRLVVLSSTSRYSKKKSSSLYERELASKLISGEAKAMHWANAPGRTLVILQPTLIYGGGKDKNVTEIARFIKRFGFFPLLGQGSGLRQPVHVDDVAAACISALRASSIRINRYIISGQEVLTYRAMVERIFIALGRKPLFFHCPLWFFALAIRLAKLLPAFKGLTTDMAVRMNRDQNFDHGEAKDDLGFNPRPFSFP